MYKYSILLSLLMVSCFDGSTTSDDEVVSQPKTVKSVIASSSESVKKSYAGLSTPIEEVNLAFKVHGQILDVIIITGEEVSAGDVLAQLDPRDLELTVAADKSSYEQTKSSYERAKRLYDHEAISKQEVESKESAFVRAKSAYENNLELLSQTSLRAPFNAVIERIYVEDYQRVQAGESIVRLVSPTTNQVSFTLPENSLSAINNSSTTFKVIFDNYPKEEFNATIVEYARSSSDASGFPVVLQFENPALNRCYINSGLSCIIEMVTPKQSSEGVILPISAIFAPTKGGTFVWIIDVNDQVKLHSVELGKPIGMSSIIIKKGVESGDRVVSAGVYQLHENQKVKVIE